MSKQSRLNKARQEREKAKANQDKQQDQSQRNDVKRTPSRQDRGEGMARQSEESGRS